jgi:hypothetical protein
VPAGPMPKVMVFLRIHGLRLDPASPVLKDHITHDVTQAMPVARVGAERSCQLERRAVQALARPQQGQQLTHQSLAAFHLGRSPVQGQLIAPQAYVTAQEALESAQVDIVLAHQ